MACVVAQRNLVREGKRGFGNYHTFVTKCFFYLFKSMLVVDDVCENIRKIKTKK